MQAIGRADYWWYSLVTAIVLNGFLIYAATGFSLPIPWIVGAWIVGAMIGANHKTNTKNWTLKILFGGALGVFLLIGFIFSAFAQLVFYPQ